MNEDLPKLESKEKLDLRVLAADDDEVNRDLLRLILSLRYSFIKIVENGQELLDELALENYDVVLTDNNMPKKTGLQALKEIRATDNNIGVVVYSTDTGTTEEDVKKLGGHFLHKPASREELYTMIEKTAEKSA